MLHFLRNHGMNVKIRHFSTDSAYWVGLRFNENEVLPFCADLVFNKNLLLEKLHTFNDYNSTTDSWHVPETKYEKIVSFTYPLHSKICT